MTKFVIPGLRLYSPNISDHWHWGKRKVHKDQVARFALAHLGRTRKRRGLRQLSISIGHVRLMDTDNAYRSVKPLVDAIKNLGWIEDDNPDLLSLSVTQHKSKSYEVIVAIG